MKKAENLKQFANKYAHFLVCFGSIRVFSFYFFKILPFTLYTFVIFFGVYLFFSVFLFFSLKKGFTFVFKTFYSAFLSNLK